MKKQILQLAFLLLAVSAFGQKTTVNWGPALESETSVYRFLAETGGKYFTLSGRRDDLYLERYNSKSFRQEFSKKLDVPKIDGKEQAIEALYYLNNKFVLFTSLYDNKGNSFSVRAYSISNDGVFDPKSKEVFSIEAESRAAAGDAGFYLSADSSKILVTHYAIFRKEKIQRATLRVYDASLNLTATGTEEFPTKENGEYVLLSNYAVNNDGEMFFLQTKITPAQKKEPMKSAHNIIMFGKDGKRLHDFPIDLEGKRVDRILFSFDVKQNLLVTGFYETKSGKGLMSYTGISGTFFMSIDKATGQEKAKSFQEFDKEIIESYFTPKQLAKNPNPALPNQFQPRQIIQKDDGGVVCIHEIYTYSYYQGNGGATETFYYGDLLVTNINPDGTIKWVKLIPKRQLFVQRKTAIGIGGGMVTGAFMFDVKKDQTIYYSFLVGIKDDKIVLVFNDDPLNKDIRPAHESEVLKKTKGAVPMQVTITESGEVSKKALFEATDFDVVIRPRISFQASDTRILIYGSKGDTDKFGVLTIE